MINTEKYQQIRDELSAKKVTLVAVSKTKPAADIQAMYDLGQRDFGENYVQELIEKQSCLPPDIRWHFIGHLQSNKVKYIAPFIHLIHSIDNEKLAQEVNKQAAKHNRVINCLLQVHIADEETKFGMDEEEVQHLLDAMKTNEQNYQHILVKGLMGMASNTNDKTKITTEFKGLKELYQRLQSTASGVVAPPVLSMGMSADYSIAIEEGSNMVRIGSLLFGDRNQTK